MNKYILDINTETKNFSNYWQKCVGSGHAGLGLRADWQKQLKFVHEEIGFKYVRFHGLLSESMRIYQSMGDIYPMAGDMLCYRSFYDIGKLFDFILSIGMKPFVEIGFMPKMLASDDKTVFMYKGNITPPKDYDKWNELIESLMAFLVDRYGKNEIEDWYFEIWNEPNLDAFWSGDMDEYFKLYKNTVESIRKIVPKAIVGGPSTANNEWLTETKDFCKKNNVPLDFLSTHHYPHSIGLAHSQDNVEEMKQKAAKYFMEAVQTGDMYSLIGKLGNKIEKLSKAPRGLLTQRAQKAKEECGDIPLIYTEWNAGTGMCTELGDSLYPAAFLTKTIMDNEGLVEMYSYWTFSDIFEEVSMFGNKPFYGGFGLLTKDGIPKPNFWAYKMLSELGSERYNLDTKTESETLEIAAFKKGEEIQLLVYNQQMPGREIKTENVEITITGLSDVKSINKMHLDKDNGNPFTYWQNMNKPEYLKKDEVEEIIEKSKILPQVIDFSMEDNSISFKLTLEAQNVVLVEIQL